MSCRVGIAHGVAWTSWVGFGKKSFELGSKAMVFDGGCFCFCLNYVFSGF